MSLGFPWLQSRKQRRKPATKNASSFDSSPDLGLLDLVNVESPPLGKEADMAPSSRRLRRNRREAKEIDREYDVVLVPPDGGCVSVSDSDDSDYSVGWLEPHGPGFSSDDDKDNSFAVLVRCYGQNQEGVVDSKNNVLSAAVKIPDGYPPDSKKYMEQLLGSLKTPSHSHC